MSKLKLFGGYSPTRAKSSRRESIPEKPTKKKRKKTSGLRKTVIALSVLIAMEAMYFFCVYTDNAFVSKWRNIYIQTAMSTMSHHWLATAFIPNTIIDEVMSAQQQAMEDTIGKESQWELEDESPEVKPEEVGKPTEVEKPETTPEPEDPDAAQREAFYELFWEVDPYYMDQYVEDHPEVLANGWDNIKINESGLNQDGTSIYSTFGEQILAIDVQNQVLLLRVAGDSYRGVLAVAKDPSRLSVENSEFLGSYGENAGVIAEKNDGILAMTGSGFIDQDGGGNGGILAGYSMSNGNGSGTAHMGWSYKRVELREDNRIYIVDAQSSVHQDTTDAVEFMPALIIDGQIQNVQGWTALNPRASIGQTKKEEILMLVVEGRLIDSLGISASECAEILKMHGAVQAMNLDGGTSAIMWYDGEYVTRCSNTAIPMGRTLPNAFVYKGE